MAHSFDAVLLHLFPDDIAPLLAFAKERGAPLVALIDHSDHTFWAGASSVDTVLHLREQCPEFLRQRRGLTASPPSPLLPIPIPPRAAFTPDGTRQAKASLGLPQDSVLMISIASPYKSEPLNGFGLLNLLEPVVTASTRTHLLAIGPHHAGAWEHANKLSGGRIAAVGRTWDTERYLQAADIYVDSYPMSSITSVLEASVRGIPVLAYTPVEQAPFWPLSHGAPGLANVVSCAGSADEYRRAARELIDSPSRRRDLGTRARDSILEHHCGAGFLEALERSYDSLLSAAPHRANGAHDAHYSEGDLDLAVSAVISRVATPLAPIIDLYAGTLPYGEKLSMLSSLARAGFAFSLSEYLPNFLARRYAGTFSVVGRVVRRAAGISSTDLSH